MRMTRGMTLGTALILAVALPLAAQIPVTRVQDSLKSMQDSARTTLLLSDALAARELRSAALRDARLAEAAIERASTEELRRFARSLAEGHHEHIVELDLIVKGLKPGPGVDPVLMGLGAGVGGDPVVGTVEIYVEEVEPVFIKDAAGNYVRDPSTAYRRAPRGGAGGRQIRDSSGAFQRERAMVYRRNPDGTFTPDTVAIYHRKALVTIPMTAQMIALMADSAEVVARFAASLEKLKGLSGKAFDQAWLEGLITESEWERARLRDRIIPMLWNEDLKSLAVKREKQLGVQERGAQDWLRRMN